MTPATDRKSSHIIQWILILTSILCILPLIYISRYVHPVNDDFSFALQHISDGWFDTVIDSYVSWSGRYLATAVSSLNPYAISTSPLPLLRAYSSALAVLLYIIPLCSAVILTRKRLGTVGACSLGVLFFMIYVSLCPSVSELLYWFSSYTAFTVPNLLVLLFLSILPRKSPIFIILQAFLALLIPGGNEVTAVLFVITLAYLYYTYRSKRLLFLLSLSVVAIVFVITSPGNGVRMTHQLSSHPYLWAICISCIQTIGWFILWIPSLVLASLMFIVSGGLTLSKSRIFRIKFRTFMIFGISAIFLAHIPPTYGLSSVMIGRTANSLLLFFILFYFWGLNIVLHTYNKRIEEWLRTIRTPVLTKMSACLTFCFIFLLPLNIDSPVSTAYCDIITSKAKRYSDIHDSRLQAAKMNASNPGEICRLKQLGITSRTLFVKELDPTPTEEFSTNYCKIYGLKGGVYVPPEGIFFESNFDSLKNLGKQMR